MPVITDCFTEHPSTSVTHTEIDATEQGNPPLRRRTHSASSLRSCGARFEVLPGGHDLMLHASKDRLVELVATWPTGNPA